MEKRTLFIGVTILCLMSTIAQSNALSAYMTSSSISISGAQDDEDRSASREAREAYRKAYDLILDENWPDARKSLSTFLEKYAESAYSDDASFWISYTLEKQGKYEDAFKSYQGFVEAYTNSKYVDDAESNMIALAKKLYQMGKTQYKIYLDEAGEDPDEDIKLQALAALGQMDSEEALPILKDVLKTSKSKKLREKAVFVISQIGGNEALETLLDLAKNDPDPDVRENAVFWIGQEGGRESLGVLMDVFKSTQNQQVREKVVFSISQIGGPEAVDI
ncbi:MAG: HEAT repeat domain-containing protein [Gemmatimonadota bacterium]|nr:MAG: HEAT repeat domain-containing protein [Gemmatimonadota bacterium]